MTRSGDLIVTGAPASVVVVPVTVDGRIVLLRQQRSHLPRPLWELPAGRLEPGADSLACAARELEAQTGYRSGWIQPVQGFHTDPAHSTERMHLFVALGLQRRRIGRAGDVLRSRAVPMVQAKRWIEEGRIQDAKTLIGLLLTLATLYPRLLPLSDRRWPSPAMPRGVEARTVRLRRS